MKLRLPHYVLGAGLATQLMFACQKQEEATPQDARAGRFVISAADYTPNGRKSSETAQFDLGPLLASKEFLFMIANGGEEPIFDIQLSSNNQTFGISPKNIKVLPGKSGSGVVPLLTVGVTHGTRLNGVGSVDNLPKGLNQATIRMVGKTISNGDTVEVTGEFIVRVEAKVTNSKFLSGNEEAVLGPVYFGLYAYVVEPAKGVKVVNSGNTDLSVTFSYVRARANVFEQQVITNTVHLQPDEVRDITNFISRPSTADSTGVSLNPNDTTRYYFSGITEVMYNETGAVSEIKVRALLSY